MQDFKEGEVILVDKPLRWTSFDVVKKVRFLIQKSIGEKRIKVGHAGTLDPLASGLLILCTGKKTKTISAIQQQKKEYKGIICLGAVTPSYDLETEIENEKPFNHLKESDLKSAAQQLSGELSQKPPIFSANKIQGKRAYTLARSGEQPEMQAKQVHVYEFEIEKIELPDIHVRIRCSKGTYIRSLAHSFGEITGAGAYLKSLRRTKIGAYKIEDSHTISELENSLKKE